MHSLAEVVASQGVHVGHIGTDDQAGDIFTKAFTDPVKWDILCKLVGVYGTNILRSDLGSIPSPKASVLCIRTFNLCPSSTANMLVHVSVGKKAYARETKWAGRGQPGADGWRRST